MVDQTNFDSSDIVRLAEEISTVFAEVLELPNVNPQENFFDIGGDSFDAIRVMSKLGIQHPVVKLFENPTAEKLARALSFQQQNDTARLVQVSGCLPRDADITFIGVPYGGGDPTIFRELLHDRPHFAVLGVDYGKQDIQTHADFINMIDQLCQQITELNAKEVLVYGHCAGSATASVLAAELKRQTLNPKLILAAAKPITNIAESKSAAEETSDEQWGEYLRTLGAFDDLSELEVAGMLERGRRDHVLSLAAYQTLYNILPLSQPLPTLILLGDADAATLPIENTLGQWQEVFRHPQTEIISNGGHYFIKTHRQAVADFIESFSKQN